MGRSYTPKYIALYRDNANLSKWNEIHWTRKGKVNDAAAEDFRVMLNKSFDLNGCNFHVSKACGVIVHVLEVRVVNQKTKQVVAKATAPMFEAF